MDLHGKLAFIGGGRMAEALIRGVIEAELIKADQVMVVEPVYERREFLKENYHIQVFENSAAIRDCGVVILAVKPQIVGKVLDECRRILDENHLLISIAAGIPLVFLEEKLAGRGCRVIRVMPNTPALIMEGASALSAGSLASDEDLAVAELIFNAVGKSVILLESDLDAVTGLSGSGPAYVFSFIEALIDSGVKVGLSRSVAEVLVLQTVLGSVKLAMETGEHPAQLRAMVTSPGGTTIAGLHAMEKQGFQGIIMDAVEAATKRSVELGQVVMSARKKE
ncbi:MAG: pyrroline-5-carboxylate reductase [Proteobacteria bacterium]|nr:pyrroline-5-carboxylate reductase [Pseudomonadota bacterium]MBU1715217.1 pyrroline-5-carboxylate reductase [Pseudomonadota bacterium]